MYRLKLHTIRDGGLEDWGEEDEYIGNYINVNDSLLLIDTESWFFLESIISGNTFDSHEVYIEEI